jgi:hypothetical protein
MDVSQVLEFLIYPLVGWNMWTTNSSATKVKVLEESTKDLKHTEMKVLSLEKSTEDLKETENKVLALQTDQAKIFEAVGGIKSDLHDIRNFLMIQANPQLQKEL